MLLPVVEGPTKLPVVPAPPMLEAMPEDVPAPAPPLPPLPVGNPLEPFELDPHAPIVAPPASAIVSVASQLAYEKLRSIPRD